MLQAFIARQTEKINAGSDRNVSHIVVDDYGASQSAYTVNADTFTLLNMPVDVTIISGPQTNGRSWPRLNHVFFYLMWMEKWHQDALWEKARQWRQFDNG